jgi:hypothetical protein
MDQDGTVLRWITAAHDARGQARRASEKAAATWNPQLAEKFEREAALHLRAASCHESTARAAWAADELHLEFEQTLATRNGRAA